MIGFYPVITLPTRITSHSATLIDNFICDISILPTNSTVIKTDLSDHFMIAIPLQMKIQTKNIYKRSFSLKNKEKFSNFLLATDWTYLYSIDNPNTAFSYFIKKIKKIHNKSFTYKKIKPSQRNTPWITTGILKSIKRKNKLYLKSKLNLNFKQDYKQYRNTLTNIIRNAKINYHRNMLTKLKNNATKLWSHLKSLTNTTANNKISLSPNTLNDFFTSVFKQAPSLNKNHLPTINTVFKNSFFLSPITTDELICTAMSLSNSISIGDDGIRPDIIKDNIALMAEQLKYIFNLSFSQGVFPEALKRAIIIPIHKGGDYSDPNNYRPISILSIFAKLIEKLYYNRLTAFVDRNNILQRNQFGFCKNKSTATAIATVLSSLLTKINNNRKVVFALLDLKKAFDFINHDLLIIKLRHYGIRGLPLQWLTDYLSSRTQKTKVNEILSDPKEIKAGCPQGSVLSGLLFNLFINDIFQLTSKDVEIYLFADDTAVLISADNDIDLQTAVNHFFSCYENWCLQNCIIVNPNKSNYLLFNTSNIIVKLNNQILENPHYTKYLGILIDDRLFWNYHVSCVTKKCSQRIGMFKKVLPYLPNNIPILYYNAFIRSLFSYCLIYWINNDRSGRYKLIEKIDSTILLMAKQSKQTT